MKRKDVVLAVIAALFLAIFIYPLASKSPDGLEKILGIKSEKVTSAAARITGVLIAGMLSYVFMVLLKRFKPRK